MLILVSIIVGLFFLAAGHWAIGGALIVLALAVVFITPDEAP